MIYRITLMDSISVDNALKTINEVKFDAIELRPYYHAIEFLPTFKKVWDGEYYVAGFVNTEEKLKKFNELLQDFQQGRLDQIQNQITDIQHEMENDPRLKALEEQIDALEKQNDELDNQKELEEKLLAVEEAKIKLQNAQKQKMKEKIFEQI